MRSFSNASTLILICALSTPMARAYQGAVSGATAESGRAAPDNNDTAFLNPAGVALLNGYYFSSTYSSGALIPNLKQKEYAIVMSENLGETLVPTAIGFNERVTTLDDRTDIRKRAQISFGKSVSETVSLGLGLNYQDDFYVQHYRQMNASLGAMWVPTASLGFAAVFDDLIPQSDRNPEALRQFSRTSFGLAYLHRTLFRVRVDLTTARNNSFGRPTGAIGVETFLNKWMLFRVGTQANRETDTNLYTAGVGFRGPRFAANYAYIRESRDNEVRHAVDLTIPLW